MPATLLDINVAYFQNLLLERRRASMQRLDDRTFAERDATESSEGLREAQDQGDSSVREAAQDARLGDAERATAEVRLLDAALARIADGTYGRCSDCERPIAERRLLSIPYAERCAECQQLADQRSGSEHHPTL
jgi:DnaK suppressor protein